MKKTPFVWVIEVRTVGKPDTSWDHTGLRKYRTRKQCNEEIEGLTWQREMGYEYRAAKYTRMA